MPTYTLSGNVSLAVEGVGATLSITGDHSLTATADSNGDFNFPTVVNGNYTLTPSKTGYTFLPTSRTIVMAGANQSGKNFTAFSAHVGPTSLELSIYLRKALSDFGTMEGGSGYTYRQDTFAANGITLSFTLFHVPTSVYPALVYVNGVLQSSGYTIVSTAISFSAAPSGTVQVVYEF